MRPVASISTTPSEADSRSAWPVASLFCSAARSCARVFAESSMPRLSITTAQQVVKVGARMVDKPYACTLTTVQADVSPGQAPAEERQGRRAPRRDRDAVRPSSARRDAHGAAKVRRATPRQARRRRQALSREHGAALSLTGDAPAPAGWASADVRASAYTRAPIMGGDEPAS